METRLLIPQKDELCGLSFLGICDSKMARQGLEMHLHKNAFEIVYLHRGTQNYLLNNRLYRLKGGDLFITFPDELHSTADFPQERTKLYWFQLDITENNLLGLQPEVAKLLIERLYKIEDRHFVGDTRFAKLIEEIFSIYYSCDDLKFIKINHNLISLLLLTIECSERPQKTELSNDIKSILDYIDQNFTNIISIEDLSKISSLSDSRIKSKFKEQIGIPPGEYIIIKRLEYAKQLILTENCNFDEIAQRCGFADRYYFTKVFKKYFNQTPSKWRTENLTDS